MTDDKVISRIREINEKTYTGLDWYGRVMEGQNMLESAGFKPVRAGRLVVLVKDQATVSFTFSRGAERWEIHQ